MKRPLFITVRSGNKRFPYKTLQPLHDDLNTIQLMTRCLGRENEIHFGCPWGDDAMAKEIEDNMQKLYWDRDGNLPLMRAVAFGEYYELDYFVFVCGDSPLLDQGTLDRLWKVEGLADFVFMQGPSGFRAKLINTRAARLWLDHVREQEEHAFSGLMNPHALTTSLLWDHTGSQHKYSLDTNEDLFFIREVLRRSGAHAGLARLNDAADFIINNYSHLRPGDARTNTPLDPTPGAD